jgi:hypothetical protein
MSSSKGYQKLFESNTGDISIILKNDSVLKLHKEIICVDSNFFQKAFESSMIESKSNEIDMSNYNESYIKTICNYLYTGTISFDLSDMELVELYILSDQLMMIELSSLIKTKLFTILNNFSDEDTYINLINTLYKNLSSEHEFCKYFIEQIFKLLKEPNNTYSSDIVNILKSDICFDSIIPGETKNGITRPTEFTSYVCCEHYHTNLILQDNLTFSTGTLKYNNISCCISKVLVHAIDLHTKEVDQQILDKSCKYLCCRHKKTDVLALLHVNKKYNMIAKLDIKIKEAFVNHMVQERISFK